MARKIKRVMKKVASLRYAKLNAVKFALAFAIVFGIGFAIGFISCYWNLQTS